jgi:hypothetical protein
VEYSRVRNPRETRKASPLPTRKQKASRNIVSIRQNLTFYLSSAGPSERTIPASSASNSAFVLPTTVLLYLPSSHQTVHPCGEATSPSDKRKLANT